MQRYIKLLSLCGPAECCGPPGKRPKRQGFGDRRRSEEKLVKSGCPGRRPSKHLAACGTIEFLGHHNRVSHFLPVWLGLHFDELTGFH